MGASVEEATKMQEGVKSMVEKSKEQCVNVCTSLCGKLDERLEAMEVIMTHERRPRSRSDPDPLYTHTPATATLQTLPFRTSPLASRGALIARTVYKYVDMSG